MIEKDEYDGWKKWQYYSLHWMIWTVVYIAMFRIAEEIDPSWPPVPWKATLISIALAAWMTLNEFGDNQLKKLKKKK